MYRVEDKYVCQEIEYRLIQKRLESVLRADDNQSGDNGYIVTSVYFDDLYDTHFRDSVDGNSMREKYRIRIYDHSLDVIKLEVKYKRYNRVMKRSCEISEEQLESLLSGKCICQSELSLDDPVTLFNLAIKERGLQPKIIVEYDRKAYVFKSGNVRITFDRNLRASCQVKRFGDKNLIYKYINEMSNVLEVKYDEFLPGFISQLLETGNMSQTSYSKYRICRE